MALTNFLVCTHLSLAGSCSHYCSDAKILVTKKQKRVQQETDDVAEPESACIHLSLVGSCSHYCSDAKILVTKKQKCVPQEIDDVAERGSGSVCIHLHLSLSCHCMEKTQITKKIKSTNLDGSWKIKKVLEKSDLGNNSRLLVSKELAKEFVIPFLEGGAKAAKGKGVEVQVLDIDDNTLHSLNFKIWTSAQSYVFTKKWVKDFVRKRNLKKGDEIGLRWNEQSQQFEFSVLRRC
ncbi:unnamed protein product [Lathyrus sativus]|nr:unnamed protein product [Lathyrus sativus]